MTFVSLEDQRDREAREWARSYEWHLSIVPPLIEVIVWMTLPSIPVSRGGSRFDRLQITGDNALRDLGDVVVSSEAAVLDAKDLWWWVNDYTQAVNEWITPTRPLPPVGEKPNPDPLSARSTALLAVGWLIDHADAIEAVAELEPHKDEMFTEIRHLRGKYGVSPRPRRPLVRCPSCNQRQVAFLWETNPNGSPKPRRIGRCRACMSEFVIHEEPAPPRTAGTLVLSAACAEAGHLTCVSVHCGCACHGRKPQ